MPQLFSDGFEFWFPCLPVEISSVMFGCHVDGIRSKPWFHGIVLDTPAWWLYSGNCPCDELLLLGLSVALHRKPIETGTRAPVHAPWMQTVKWGRFWTKRVSLQGRMLHSKQVAWTSISVSQYLPLLGRSLLNGWLPPSALWEVGSPTVSSAALCLNCWCTYTAHDTSWFRTTEPHIKRKHPQMRQMEYCTTTTTHSTLWPMPDAV